ncbi:MAG: insulinase family protein [Bacteroidetes bacterium]|nr:MAG: insulinase family protein [Bacteroidota bacterium]REK07011.1 MAG: insulinase family protein [Bacteroidota bacterium]REK33642.1 MAG: insulinase family protein [Bacteroidota bacterium]REK48628.1 MAG: insulinase family protein [Bacteroidota bacterium]
MSGIIDRSMPPELKEIREVKIPRAEKVTLDNGVPMYYINSGLQELVKVELIFENLEFPADKPVIPLAVNRLMSEGTSRHSAQELADLIDYYGAYLNSYESPDYSSLSLFTLNKHLGAALPTVREMLSDAVFPQEEIDVLKRNSLQRLAIEDEKVSAVARKNFARMCFGNHHPYGHEFIKEDYNTLLRSDLMNYYKSQYISGHCTIVASGKIDDAVIRTINLCLGDAAWSRSNGKVAGFPDVIGEGEMKNYIPKDGAIQSAIRIGKRSINRSHPDYPGLAVMNTILGGYFGSRLMSNIREDKGYTYGIGSANISYRRDGLFFISTEVGADVTEKALTEIYFEIEKLRNDLVPESELRTVKNYMMGNHLKSIENAFHISDKFKSIYLSGLDYSYFDRFVRKLKSIRPDEIRELAVKYLDPAQMTELVVGRK